MKISLFDAAQRVEKMIGREGELRDIAKALYAPGDECRIVLITNGASLTKS
jgi:hypothetical protein